MFKWLHIISITFLLERTYYTVIDSAYVKFVVCLWCISIPYFTCVAPMIH